MLTCRGFLHNVTGPQRPQIVIVGNGLEKCSGQPSWADFLDDISAPGCVELTKEQKKELPFPLLYELLSTPFPAPAHITTQDITDQEKRLSEALKKLKNRSNLLLDQLVELGADHIFTTNYSYCIENAFWPRLDFLKPYARSTKRFNFSPMNKKGNQKQEGYYRMHSGYLAKVGEEEKRSIGIWHIHGECSAPRGVILGADRYGRNLEHIIHTVSNWNFKDITSEKNEKIFTAWPELFLFGDLYIIGLGYETCDNDLWWLLRRKQREHYSDSHVYFYEFRDENSVKQKLLQAHGVIIPSIGKKKPENDEEYQEYYQLALDDIRKRIKSHT